MQEEIDIDQLEREQKDALRSFLMKKDFCLFFKKAFSTTNPGRKYEHNWHVDCICEHLQAVERGEIKRLNINIPPRFLKSEICSIAYPAWILGKNPTKKVITFSYSATLSQELHNKCRRVVDSQWFKNIFPTFNISTKHTKDTQTGFITSKMGSKVATSTHGSATGKGGDILILDDIMNPDEALSDTQRKNTISWYSGTVFSRMDDSRTGQIINIQQRLHEEDFTGTFCDSSWESIVIPIKFDKPTTYSIGDFKKSVKEGEFLHEARFGEEEYNERKKQMGSYSFAGQYEQNPAPLGGGIIKEKWFKYWKVLPTMQYRKIFADTALKEGERNDFSVLQCWGLGIDGYAYLIDQIRGKWEAPELVKTTELFWLKHKNRDTGTLRKLVVEDKASGTGLIQTIQREKRIPVEAVKPNKDKVGRVNDIVGWIESGYVFLPQEADFVSDFVAECNAFPNATHDDQVDVLAYALLSIFVNQESVPIARGWH